LRVSPTLLVRSPLYARPARPVRPTLPVRLALCLTLALQAAGCSAVLQQAPVSPPPRHHQPQPQQPQPQPPGPIEAPAMLAGVARIDITPPVGGGLLGYGPEGKRSDGYRQRLWARVLVLEDGTGERIAIVSAELMAASVVLHREVAARTVARSGIGADRLIIAATHTHAAPGHYFGLAFETLGTATLGGWFDHAWTHELADRIAAAVDTAYARREPATLRWTSFPVRGVTFNRNMLPYHNNAEPWRSPFDRAAPAAQTARATPTAQTAQTAQAPAPTDPYDAVDPQWLLLRVDRAAGRAVDRAADRAADRADGATAEPLAALSVFAMHGTGNPSANTLYDADLHGWFSQAFERAVDAALGRPRGPWPGMVHLFANGSAGDVSAMPAATRCPVPTLHPRLRPSVLTAVLPSAAWVAPPADEMTECVRRSRAHMSDVVDRLLPEVLARFEDAPPATGLAEIRRAFTTIRPGPDHGVCRLPLEGSASAAGVADGRTRYALAGVPHVQEGGTALADPKDAGQCHYPKRPLMSAGMQRLAGRIDYLPREVQLAVVRIGDVALGVVPFEVTTTAGGRMKDAIAAALAVPDSMTGLISIANGYIHYVVSRDEYQLQHYEGAATIWGPASAAAFSTVLAGLAADLRGAATSPPPVVGDARAWSRRPLVQWPALPRPEPRAVVERSLGDARCSGDTLVFSWKDVGPGRLTRAPYPVLAIEQQQPDGGWLPLVWDDDPHLEVRYEGGVPGGHSWNARWSARPPDPVRAIRAVLIARPDHPPVHGTPVQPCT
jgi:neutral ceramidase